MRFIQPCFIRKNTPELREKLRNIGQRHNDLDHDEYEWLAANHGMFISVSEGFERLPTDDIDCGTDEDLFLALAAMTDEPCNPSEYYIVTSSCYTYDKGQVTQFLPLMSSIHPSCYRKATAQEIIGYFKNKKHQP